MTSHIDKEKIRRSIELAENLARAESRVEIWRTLCKEDLHNETCKNSFRSASEFLRKCRSKIKEDELAQRILPEARLVVASKKKRERALENSPLGNLRMAVSTLSATKKDPAAGSDLELVIDESGNQALNDNLRESWRVLRDFFVGRNNDSEAAMDGLASVLSDIFGYFMNEENLPPVRKYEFMTRQEPKPRMFLKPSSCRNCKKKVFPSERFCIYCGRNNENFDNEAFSGKAKYDFDCKNGHVRTRKIYPGRRRTYCPRCGENLSLLRIVPKQ